MSGVELPLPLNQLIHPGLPPTGGSPLRPFGEEGAEEVAYPLFVDEKIDYLLPAVRSLASSTGHTPRHVSCFCSAGVWPSVRRWTWICRLCQVLSGKQR